MSFDHELQQKLENFLPKSSTSTLLPAIDSLPQRRRSLGKIVKVVDDKGSITLWGVKTTVCISCYDDGDGGNDSHASIDIIKGNLNDLVDQELVSAVTYSEGEIQKFYGEQHVDSEKENYELHVLETSNGKTVHILGQHHHNGWYSGGSYMSVSVSNNLDFTKSRDGRLIFVMGLPASGKTTYCQNNFANKSEANGYPLFHVKDDVLFQTDHRLEMMSLLEQGQNVVMCDPRLCSLDNFNRLYELAYRCLVSPSTQIGVVYFENDKEKCLANKHRPELEEDIDWLNKYYNKTIAHVEELMMKNGGMVHKVPVYEAAVAGAK